MRATAASYRPDVPYRPDVQGLRAVAVLLVVGEHVLGVPQGGYVGVDVFFVVSGFLITGLLLREHARSGSLDLRQFFARRVRRLLPAALLVLAATNLASLLVFPGERAGQVLRDSAWGLGLANVHFAALGTDYSDATRPPSPVLHLWSLAVEEQFYLVWPLVLLTLLAVLGRRAVLGVGALVAASFAWSVLSTAATPTAAYFSTPARAWELGAGALLALAVRRQASRPWASWTGLGLIAVAAVAFDERTAFPGSAAVLPVLGTVLVLLGGAPLRVLVHPVSAYVGRLSYSLYLWHWPVLVLASALLPAGVVRTAAVLTGAAVCSVLSLHLVEDPVRRSGWLARRTAPSPRWSMRTAVALTATASLVLGGWVVPALALRTAEPAVAAPAPAAVPQDLPALVASSVAPAAWPRLDLPLASISGTGAPEWLVDRCDNVNAGNVDRCRYGDLTAPRTAVVVGDSMATSWLPALRALLDPREWSVHVLTRNQCPLPRLGFWRERPAERFTACDEHKEWAFARVRALRPDLVLASNSTTMLDHQQGERTGAARFASWRMGMTRTLEELVPYAGRVVVLSPPPRAGNLQSCVTRLSSPVDCTTHVSADWVGLRSAERGAAATAGAEHVDVEDLFCAAGRCPGVVGSTPVYTDGRHLTAAYARRLAPQLGQLLSLG
jgi:peptidoglycan/LPS O-acetylase OafA/YrhL